MKILIETYNAKELSFVDPVFGLNRKWTEKFCQEIIKERFDVVWSALTRVDLTDEHLLRLMKKSGCWMLYYGVEAGDQQLLDNIKKGMKLKDIERSIKLTNKVGIRTWGSFMFGLPGETPALARKTLDFAKKMPLDFASFHLTTPYPGTELWLTHNQWGEIGMDLSKFTQYDAVFIPSAWKGKGGIFKKC